MNKKVKANVDGRAVGAEIVVDPWAETARALCRLAEASDFKTAITDRNDRLRQLLGHIHDGARPDASILTGDEVDLAWQARRYGLIKTENAGPVQYLTVTEQGLVWMELGL